jgi:NAD(P)-dependent dehydrogenase (short-subunit alcohol dehydrogenase family)
VATEITQGGGEALAVSTDVSRPEDVAALFQRTHDTFGSLDILINNAGVGAFGQLVDVEPDALERVLAVNVRGTFLCCQEAMRRMIPEKSGTIINIASVVGFRGYPRQSAYAASKHAVMGITKSLAVEAAEHNIRVSAVLPGGVNTTLIGDARPDLDRSTLLQGEDIAQTVLFLLSLPEHAAIDEIYIRRRSSAPF